MLASLRVVAVISLPCPKAVSQTRGKPMKMRGMLIVLILLYIAFIVI